MTKEEFNNNGKGDSIVNPPFNLSEKIGWVNSYEIRNEEDCHTSHKQEVFEIEDVKEFIKRRLERIDLIIKLYPHKSGEELAGQLKEDLMNDAGDELI